MIQYKTEVLTELQNVEREILRKFDELCIENGIEYFVMFGTEIGAIRHQGFIPWDDDIDVGMMRTDYEKLRALDKEKWGGEYLLVDPEDSCPYQEKVFSRVYKVGTVFTPTELNTRYFVGEEQQKPIGIDIFIFDFVDSEEQSVVINKQTSRLKGLYLWAKYKAKNEHSGNILKDVFRMCAKRFFFYANKILRGNVAKIIYRQFVRKVNHLPAKYAICYCSFFDEDVFGSFCEYNSLYPLRRMKFDDIVVNVRNSYDECLRRNYGDYMKMPPLEKRQNHPPLVLDFGYGQVDSVERRDS